MELSCTFDEEEFEKNCGELENPDTEGWEFFTESHNVKIYRLYHADTGLYQYKVYGDIDVDPKICAEVYKDLKYRKTWDSYAKELKTITSNSNGDETIYWEVNFPFPMWNRDYIYARTIKEVEKDGMTHYVALSKGIELESVPEKKGIVRVKEYQQTSVLRTNLKNGTKAYMNYFDNPGGSIPTWLINWAASKGVPNFLSDMTKACNGYPAYLKSLEGKPQS